MTGRAIATAAAGLRDRLLHAAIKPLPVRLCSAIGAGVSIVPRLMFRPTHRDVKRLLAALRPDWGADEVRLERAARRVWMATARTYAEIAVVGRMVKGGRVTIENVGIVDAAMATGRPVILTFVHTGNWEASGMQLAFRYPGRILAIYAPPDNPTHAEIAMRARRVMPADFVPMSRGMWRQALARLQRPGGVLWIAADEFAEGKVRAPFFGRPRRTDGNLGKIARLALRTGAIVVPFYSERHPGPRFTTHILPTLEFVGSSQDEGAVRAAVDTMEATMRPHVIRLLDQWYMALFYHDHASLS